MYRKSLTIRECQKGDEPEIKKPHKKKEYGRKNFQSHETINPLIDRKHFTYIIGFFFFCSKLNL